MRSGPSRRIHGAASSTTPSPRLVEQPQRTRRAVTRRRRIRVAACALRGREWQAGAPLRTRDGAVRGQRRLACRVFGPMLGLRGEHGDDIVAKPRAQPVDERHGDGVGFVFGQKAEVASRERRRFVARQHDRFDRRRQRDARKPLAQHRMQMRRCARRRAERERRDRRRRSALAHVALVHERQRHAHDAESARQQPAGEIVHQPIDAEAERLDVVDGCRQRQLALEMRRRHVRLRGSGARPSARSSVSTTR